uniref:Sucrose synthase N-terminal domain-containing protein n=1 Tax=Salix viminalis TaxID=40686 RepID=A0A6N2LHH0_SALVM
MSHRRKIQELWLLLLVSKAFVNVWMRPSRLIATKLIEGKGKGILQHHHIIAEFEAISEEIRNKLAGGAFSEVLRSTQQLFCLHGLLLLCAQGLVSGSTSG